MVVDHSYIILIGLLAGTLSGLMGVGGGTITIPALVLLFGFSQHLAQGISLAIIVPTAIIGAYGYYRKGYIDPAFVLPLILGAICGALLGSTLAAYVPGIRLQQIFGIFALYIGVKMIRTN